MARNRKISLNQKKKQGVFNKRLLLLTVFLTLVGIVIVADVSSPQALRVFQDSFYFAKQQAMWGAIGLALMVILSFTDYKIYEKYALFIFITSLALLIAVLIPGLGINVLGARRWIAVGPISVQPSEVMKLTLAIFFAKLSLRDYPLHYFLIVLGVVGGLIMLQPDLGTTLIVTGIGFVQLFVMGTQFFLLLGVGGLGALLAGLLIMFSDYRKARLVTFMKNAIDPLGPSSADAAGSAYHVRQILIALGSGGLFGVGIGHSRQKHLFLPETATDSVFAIVAEEVGFIGATALILVLTIFMFQLIKVAKNAPDKFSLILASGIVAWIGGQMFLNIASMVALVPLTGVPLPFFSYGGSSLTMMLISIGILLNISKQSEK